MEILNFLKSVFLKRHRLFNIAMILVVLSFFFCVYAFQFDYTKRYDLGMASLIFSLAFCLFTIIPKYEEIVFMIMWIAGNNLKDELLDCYSRFYVGEYILFILLIFITLKKILVKYFKK